MGSRTHLDAIVIGGGFAGLSAATALVEAGARVTVLEARPALGGRTTSYKDPTSGELVDNGQHVLLGCYHETLRFLRRIAAMDRLHRPSGLAVSMVDRKGRTSTLSLPPLTPPFHLVAGVLAWDAVSWAERMSLGGIVRALARARGEVVAGRPVALDAEGESVRAWLVRHGQGSRLIELLWEPLALAALNQPIDVAAAPHFVGVLARMFGPDAEDAAILLPAVPLSALCAEPARRWLDERGAMVRTHAVARIVVEKDTPVGIRVGQEMFHAPVVVAAVPWFGLSSIFESAPASMAAILRDAADTDASPIVTVNLWFDRRVLPAAVIGLPGRAFQWAFDKRAIMGGTHVSLVSSGAASIVRQANDELVAVAARELRDALPDARAAVLQRGSVVRERRATFSLAPGAPDRPGTVTPVRGLWLAGDWIDTGLPATIESACVSGHLAAAAASRV